MGYPRHSSASNEGNYRTAAYEAISSFVAFAPQEAISVVQNTIVSILDRMEQLLGMQVRHTRARAPLQIHRILGHRIKFWVWTIVIIGMTSRPIFVVS